ncbi:MULTISPECIES: substrate-binding periplasmic protein [Pseudoalteromonas]|uniref:substrate-binding periplasmic protein n=1 Tax=Pseudoalteromonas TaxID=53246 RepID=UPI001EFDAAEF|nr:MULTISPECIES: transporter substrate-binding domain-containing protein [Pseudoalteromonas]MCG9759599.1 transporter substrate-binding domain-containing protein [Pseudoalteromonas sp. Isolate6]
MMMLKLSVMVTVLMFQSTGIAAQTSELIYVAKEARALYDRDLYLYELLEKALVAAKYSAQIEHIKVHPHQQRTLMALSRGKVDLHWSMTSPAREQIAIPIKIPLYGGLIGKRVLIVHKDVYPAIKTVRSLDELKRFTAVQGHDWPDTKILSYNGLKVRPISDYQTMFNLIADKKADYFPRSVIEANSELIAQNNENLMIVPDFHLMYSTAFYFFVNKDKQTLAEALEEGLSKLSESGELQLLKQKYGLSKHPDSTAITLNNPYFSEN